MNKVKNNNQDNNRSNFDDILNYLGNIGRYQWEIYILSILPVFIAGMLSTSFIFTTATPDYRCLVDTCDIKIANGTEHPIFNEEFLQYTTPLKNNPGKAFQFDRCHKYSIINDYNSSSINGTDNEETLNSCLAERFDNNKIISCDNYIFDKQYFHSTIVTEFNLWCNYEWLVQIVQMLFFFGVLVGAIVNGILADKFGRKIIFQIYSPVTCLAILVCTLAYKWYFYAIGLFLKGMCVAAIYQSSFTIGIECLGGSWRFWMGNSYAVIFAAGGIYASLMADWLRDWHHIEMTNLIPAVLMLPYPFILCESIRWQFSAGQTSNALQQIALAAQKNGTEIPDKILKEFMTINDNNVKVKSDVSIKDLFTHQLIRTWTITFLYIWFTNSLVYYGFSFLAGDINPNIYLSMILLMIVEFPGTFLAAYLGEFGRKIVLIGTMILCGGACIVGSFASGQIKMWLSILGKMAISGSFALIYIYVAEIFPTVLRITGIGMCSFCARIGAMIAPYIFKLNIFGDSVPFLAIGIISLLAGLSGFLLPETKGKKLPNTLDEVEQLKYASNIRHNDYRTMSDGQSKSTDNIL